MSLTADAERQQTDALLNDFVRRSFRDIADGDYIAARMLYRAMLIPQFLWSSQQAIEKYLKAILVINREPALRIGHNISLALSRVESIRKLRFRVSDDTCKFLDYLASYGPFRYLEVSYHARGRSLVELDRAVWEIRRYCDVLDYEIYKPNGSTERMLEHELSRIESSALKDPVRFRWFNGRLEQILAKRKDPARAFLIWKNFYFGGRSRRTIRLSDWSHSVNAPLALNPGLFEEIRKYVTLPRELIAEFEDLNRARSRI